MRSLCVTSTPCATARTGERDTSVIYPIGVSSTSSVFLRARRDFKCPAPHFPPSFPPSFPPGWGSEKCGLTCSDALASLVSPQICPRFMCACACAREVGWRARCQYACQGCRGARPVPARARCYEAGGARSRSSRILDGHRGDTRRTFLWHDGDGRRCRVDEAD